MRNNRLSQVQRERDLPDEELAYLVRRSVRTIRNLKCGNSSSLALRQKITNICRTKIWPDVDVTERVVVFKPGTDVELSPISAARGWARDFNKLDPGVAVQRGNVLSFCRPIAVTMQILNPKRSARAQTGKISANSNE